MGKKSTTIRHVVKLTDLIKRWKPSSKSAPSDVPPGHVAIIVGCDRRRFVMRATHLSHPAFRGILVDAEEEYGFSYLDGPVSIPCDESAFFHALRLSAGLAGASHPLLFGLTVS